jgi:hypothetical protein
MSTEQIKHLEFIQAVIARMANNSFLLKGWSVTLAVTLLGLAVRSSSPKFAALALVPPICFWAPDAYYLRQERLFRKLYDQVRQLSTTEWPETGQFNMSTDGIATEVSSWVKTLLAPTIFGIHLTVIVLVIAVVALLRVCR